MALPVGDSVQFVPSTLYAILPFVAFSPDAIQYEPFQAIAWHRPPEKMVAADDEGNQVVPSTLVPIYEGAPPPATHNEPLWAIHFAITKTELVFDTALQFIPSALDPIKDPLSPVANHLFPSQAIPVTFSPLNIESLPGCVQTIPSILRNILPPEQPAKK